MIVNSYPRQIPPAVQHLHENGESRAPKPRSDVHMGVEPKIGFFTHQIIFFFFGFPTLFSTIHFWRFVFPLFLVQHPIFCKKTLPMRPTHGMTKSPKSAAGGLGAGADGLCVNFALRVFAVNTNLAMKNGAQQKGPPKKGRPKTRCWNFSRCMAFAFSGISWDILVGVYWIGIHELSVFGYFWCIFCGRNIKPMAERASYSIQPCDREPSKKKGFDQHILDSWNPKQPFIK